MATEEKKFGPQVLDTGVDGQTVDRTEMDQGETPGPSAHDEPVLEKGTCVGRYLVAARIGKGGMGEVYQAFDPDLNRPVALKLLTLKRKNQDDSDADSLHRSRLLREAQALAQLAHPNVVTVYDVGVVDDSVFIAMELVEGQTLADWRTEKTQNREEICAVMQAAGAGLAAAHQAGIIHRDFKPANIIIGRDDRVRVLDFGLARAVDPEPLTGQESKRLVQRHLDRIEQMDRGEMDSSGSLLSSSLTQAGSIMGTPRYMAPEQHLGQKVDERSDQFSFCVVLFESLFGCRPFQGQTFRKFVANVLKGKVALPEDKKNVPDWLTQVILRGLQSDPAQRYASMEALLGHLAADPEAASQAARHRRRRGLAMGVMGLAALLVAAFGIWYGATKGHRFCQPSASEMTGVWDRVTQSAVAKSFRATHLSYAEDSLRRVEQILDRKVKAWMAMRVEACEATHVRGVQSDRLLDLRMACLDRRRQELRALTALFAAGADAKVVDRAVPAIMSIASLRGCADAEELNAAVPLPANKETRARVKELRVGVGAAKALRRAGKFADGLALLQDAADLVKSLTYAPVRAEYFFELGSLQSDAGSAKPAEKSLRRALGAAAEARDDKLLAKVKLQLVYVVGYHLGRHDEALAFGQVAESELPRTGSDPWICARSLTNIGVVFWDKGEMEPAREYLERAIALYDQNGYAQHPDVASALNVLAVVFEYQSRDQDAKRTYQRALALYENALGPGHPDVAMVSNNLGEFYNGHGQYSLGQKHCRRALRIGEAALASDHPAHAYHLTCLADATLGMGQASKAVPLLERALAIFAQAELTPKVVAITKFLLARALWSSKQDRKRAILLSQQSRRRLAQSPGEFWQKNLVKVDHWLQERALPD